MQAIGDLKAEFKEDIGDMKASVAAGNATAIALANAAQNTAMNLRQELLGEGGRLTQIEEHNSFKWKVELVFGICIIPFLALLHQIAAHFGWIK